MDDLTIILDPGETLAVRALAGASESPERIAHDVLREALTARLDVLGLPWPGAAESRRDSAANTSGGWWDRPMLRSALLGVVALAAIITLSGGYGAGWTWTGFRDNNQLWDWLSLLVLPLAFATIPLWLRSPEIFSRSKRIAHAAIALAFAVFVIVGYTAPLGWTGFSGNRLWDWLVLLLLPATLVVVTTWSSTGRTVRRRHVIALGVLATGWLITVLGGYVWGWKWTGYKGNTLWDWLQLLLLPLVVPTIVAPAAANFVSRPRTNRRAEPAPVSAQTG
ncbi:MAG TPA: hypothetical protein VFE19_13995 [Jatrophihabitantaceae bacterium]|nr:hypothetical protein [Jatrophihabitantaceae bacterium]